MISPQWQTGSGTGIETQGAAMGQALLAPEGHRTTTSKTQTLPQSTIPIIPITTQNAGTTGGTGETAWALDQVTTATRDTATTTILTTTMAAAAAEGAAMTATGTETEIETETGIETETETVTTPTALTPDTIPILTALPQTACLLPRHLTPHTPPKSLPQPLLRDWMFPPVLGAQACQRGDLFLQWVLKKTTTLVITVLCLHLLRRRLPSLQPQSLRRL